MPLSLAIQPDYAALRGLNVGVIAPWTGPDAQADVEVRAFMGEECNEDAVTGSLNASLAQWLIGTRDRFTDYRPLPSRAGVAARLCTKSRVIHRRGGLLPQNCSYSAWARSRDQQRLSLRCATPRSTTTPCCWPDGKSTRRAESERTVSSWNAAGFANHA